MALVDRNSREGESLLGMHRNDLVTPEIPGVNTPIWMDEDKSGTPVPGAYNPLVPAPGTSKGRAINDTNPPINQRDPGQVGNPPPPQTPQPDPNQQVMTALNQIMNRLNALEQGGGQPPAAEPKPAVQIQGYDDLIREARTQADQFVESPELVVDLIQKVAERTAALAEQNALNRMVGAMPEIYNQTRKAETEMDAWFRRPENQDLEPVRAWVEQQASALRAEKGHRGNIIQYFDQAAPLIRAAVGDILRAKMQAGKANPADGAALPSGGSRLSPPPKTTWTPIQKQMMEHMGVRMKPMSELYPNK